MAALSVAERPRLETPLDRLQAAFVRYELAPDMARCPHCVTPGDVAALVASPSAKLLHEFALKALTTWGGPTEFRALLPRLLAGAVDGTLGLSPIVVAEKLRVAGWLSWPKAERQAVSEYLQMVWTGTLATAPSYPTAVDVLGAIAVSHGTVKTQLEQWHEQLAGDSSSRRVAVSHLARFALTAAGVLEAERSLSALLWCDEAVASAVTSWLLGTTTAIHLDRAVFDFGRDKIGPLVTEARDRVTSLRI